MRLDTYRSFCKEMEWEDMSHEAGDGAAYYTGLREKQEREEYWTALLADVDRQLGMS